MRIIVHKIGEEENRSKTYHAHSLFLPLFPRQVTQYSFCIFCPSQHIDISIYVISLPSQSRARGGPLAIYYSWPDIAIPSSVSQIVMTLTSSKSISGFSLSTIVTVNHRGINNSRRYDFLFRSSCGTYIRQTSAMTRLGLRCL